MHVDQGQHGQRGVFAGLHHHGVAHAQGRGQLPDARSSSASSTGRWRRRRRRGGSAVSASVGSVVHEHLGLEVEGRRGAQPGGAGPDLEAGVGPVQRLALLAREQLGQRLGVGLDGVGGPVQQGAACLVAQCVPFRLRRTGGGDGGLKVRDLVFRCAAHQFAGGRVEDFAPAGGRLDGGQQIARRWRSCWLYRCSWILLSVVGSKRVVYMSSCGAPRPLRCWTHSVFAGVAAAADVPVDCGPGPAQPPGPTVRPGFRG